MKVVGGEMGGDDSGIVVSENGVTKTYGEEIVGCQHVTSVFWYN